jgi:hypothetical protein
MQEEIASVVLAYLPNLDSADNTQLLQALRAMVANFATKATTLAGYGILDAYTKPQVDSMLAQKANWAITLGGYGITDAYTKAAADALLAAKAAKATTLGGYGITDAYTTAQTDTKLAAKQDKNTATLGVNGSFVDSATGRVEVWGTVTLEVATATGSRSDAAVVFPTPFPNAAFNVSFSSTGGNSSEVVENVIGFTSLTKTGMTVSAQRVSGTQTGGEKVVVHYRVIGN